MTHPGDIDHEAIVTRSLAMLGARETPLLGFDVLAGGASGAITYHLRQVAGDAVLKVTLPDSSWHLLARARREVLFYRYLAPKLPIRVPTVIAAGDDEADGIALLLGALQPPPEPPGATWVTLAAWLARFHATFWRKEERLATMPWLRSDVPELRERRLAHRFWHGSQRDERFSDVLTPARFRRVAPWLWRICLPDPVVEAFPRTLCHGDFHLGNILADRDGTPVLADWQEVGPGRGPADLTFLLQRATASGYVPPREAMIAAYRDALRAATSEDVPIAAIQRVMDRAELYTRLVHWPAFIENADQLADLVDRIVALADALDHDPRNV